MITPLLSAPAQAAAAPTSAQPVAEAPADTAAAGDASFSRELARAQTPSHALQRPDAKGTPAERSAAKQAAHDDAPRGQADADAPTRGARGEHKLRHGGRGAGQPAGLPSAAVDETLATSAQGDGATAVVDPSQHTPPCEGSAQALLEMTALMATVARAAPAPSATGRTDAAAGEAPQPPDLSGRSADVADLPLPQAADAQLAGAPAPSRGTPLVSPDGAAQRSVQPATDRIAGLGERAATIDDATLALSARSSRIGGSFVPAASAAEAGLALAGAVTSVAATAPGTPPGHAAAFHAELAAAVGSNEFAPALGAQLSTLVREGVSHARLNLHPAELGPVSVHIRLDGELAQVDFSAAHALTRQALEDAVPALASALRDSGLTLSGGGVFEHPPARRDARDAAQDHAAQAGRGQGASDAQAADAMASGKAAPTLQRTRSRGVVDLYA